MKCNLIDALMFLSTNAPGHFLYQSAHGIGGEGAREGAWVDGRVGREGGLFQKMIKFM